MNTFKKEKFKKVINHKSGYTWSKEQELSKPNNGALRVLTITNVQKELELSSELYLKNVSEKDRVNKAVSKEWTIAVSSNGNRKRIGNAVFIEEDTEFLFASFLTAFKPKPDSDILPKYFYYWFNSHTIQERITSVSEGTTGLGNLDIRYLRNIDIEYPQDLAEQRKIASILTKVDDAIQAVKNTIEKAERLKKSLMQNLLTGNLKPDGTWRTEDEFYIDEKFGKVPVGWEVKKWGQLITLEYGRSLNGNKEGEIPVYGTNGQIGYTSMTMCNSEGIIVGRKGAYREIHYSNKPFWVIDTAFYAVPKIDLCILWAYYSLKIIDINRFDSGSAIPSTNKKDVYFNKAIVPPKTEQILISAKITSIAKIIESKKIKIQKLEFLKKSLMQNLLTGKVRVKV